MDLNSETFMRFLNEFERTTDGFIPTVMVAVRTDDEGDELDDGRLKLTVLVSMPKAVDEVSCGLILTTALAETLSKIPAADRAEVLHTLMDVLQERFPDQFAYTYAAGVSPN